MLKMFLLVKSIENVSNKTKMSNNESFERYNKMSMNLAVQMSLKTVQVKKMHFHLKPDGVIKSTKGHH